eukprot:363541_1
MLPMFPLPSKHFYWLYGFTAFCLVICIVIAFIILVHLFRCKICLSLEAAIPVHSVLHLSIISISSFIICLISQLFIISSISNNGISGNGFCYQLMIICLSYISWSFGQLFIYLLFIHNLRHTFKNTLLQISKSTTNILYILVIIFFLSRLVY